MAWKIPLFKIYWDEDDVEAVSNVIRRGTYWANGKEIPEFEEEIAKFVGTKYAVAFNSGTSALHALFLAYDIQSSEVIVPSFTFIATANSVLMANGKVVFAEVETDSFGLDANDVNEKINKKTKAIMPVHIAGQPCKDIKELTDIAQDKNLLLLEDAAQTLGSYNKYGKSGAFGDAAAADGIPKPVAAMPAAPTAPAVRKSRRLIPFTSCSFVSALMIISSSVF